jgi:hypothetical protein
VRARVAADAMPPAAAASTVVLAGLGDEVCVVGAGAVAFDRLDALAAAPAAADPAAARTQDPIADPTPSLPAVTPERAQS